jgi:hypothetical protein
LLNEGAALRHKYFVESRNSLAETVGAMDLAAAIGVVRQDDADAVQKLRSRLRRMLTALLRSAGHRGRDDRGGRRITLGW